MDLPKFFVVLFIVGTMLYVIKHFGYMTLIAFQDSQYHSQASTDLLRKRAFAWSRLLLLGTMILALGIALLIIGVTTGVYFTVCGAGVVLMVIGQVGYLIVDGKVHRK